MRLLSLTAVLGLPLALSACSGNTTKHTLTPQEMIQLDPLPMAKGDKWTYNVTVNRFDPDADKVITKTLQWTTEVVDTKVQNGVIAYRIKGWPSDLASVVDGDAPPVATEKTLLRSQNNFLWGATDTTSLDGAEGWFQWPVIDGQKICPSAETVYCWRVAAVDTGYELSFFTGPDEQTFQIEPGTGVRRFHYAHHGTTNEVEAKLVDHVAAR